MNQEIALNLFQYKEGKLFWKINPGPWKNLKDKEAGYLNSEKRRVIKSNGKSYKTHRIIWMMHYGEIPKHLTVDHINRDRLDNRIDNLRLATATQQSHNTKAKGYSLSGPSYQVTVGMNGKNKYIGKYGTECAARLAYLMEKLQWNLAHKTV